MVWDRLAAPLPPSRTKSGGTPPPLSPDDLEVAAPPSETWEAQTRGIGGREFPRLEELAKCTVPSTYPATPAYKRAEFAPLPALAKGQADANECTGVAEVSLTPAAGSPRRSRCTDA